MALKTFSKIFLLIFFFGHVQICKTDIEEGEGATTNSASATVLDELTLASTEEERIEPSNTSDMTEEVCSPRDKRETPSVSDAEMAMAVRLEWERENFYDGEMAEYYEENSVTEWDLYSFFHDVAGARMSESFTMIKAIMQNVTFKQDMKNIERESYKEIRGKMQTLINSINSITNQSLLSPEVFLMTIDKTEDCLVKFILYIPWNEMTPASVKKIGGKDILSILYYFDNLLYRREGKCRRSFGLLW